MTNEELIVAYQSTKNEKLIDALLNQCRHMAVYACRNVRESDREDCLQSCLIAIWKSMDTFDAKKGKFSTYICARFKWVVMDFVKKLPRNQVPFIDISSHLPRFGIEGDLKEYLSFIPQSQAQALLTYFQTGVLGSKSLRTIKSSAIRNLREVVKQI